MSGLLDPFDLEGKVGWDGRFERGKARFPDGKASSAVRGRIITEELPRDWSGYGSLQFTVHNPWPRAVVGGIEIYDTAALESPELEYGDFVDRHKSLLIGEGITHVVIRIDPIQTTQGNRMLDLRDVVRVALRFPEPEEGEEPISLASLRLSPEREEVDRLANAHPGDSVLVMRHLDVSCYIFEPENYAEPVDVLRLTDELSLEKEKLQRIVDVADMNGKQTLYARTALVAADIALKARPMLAWHASPRAKRENLSGALELVREEREKLEQLFSSRRHEDDEDDSNLPLPLVKPLPDFKSLRIKGRAFVDRTGQPVLICAMSYINEGPLLQFFAPEQHKLEIYAAGGGSRYDIEWSPVYEAFHKYPGTKRVGWRGWCGHLIKDQWAMGGRKENVVICLESEPILQAIDEYNRIHADDWREHPSLMYVILGYELTYMCYCDESLRRFRDWLAERHGNIEALNDRWGTAYHAFNEAEPPRSVGFGPQADANRAAWFDWADWNTRRFTDHLRWSRESVRKLHPDIPICAGGTHSMLSPHNGTTGIDEEMIINEVDDVILHEGADLLSIDLLHALSEKPMPMVDPEHGGRCSGWLLNYFHGKSTLSMFWWPKQPSRQFPASTLHSPMYGNMKIKFVAEHLRTALHARRLNKEISAFWEIPKEIAILYSKTNMLQVPPELLTAKTTDYLTALRGTYDAARCLDAGITFISEKQLLEGKAARLKCIALPAVKHLPEAVFEALDQFARNGGSILVLPESLTRDEYDRPANYLERWSITIGKTEMPEIEGFGELEQRYDQNLERGIQYGRGREIEAASFDGKLTPPPRFVMSGIFQQISFDEGEVVAAGPAAEPMLVRIPIGAGTVWYAAGMPEKPSFSALLDHWFAESGIHRPLYVTDADGNRIPGLEARLVRRQHDDLVYLVNESGKDAEFRIQTDRPIHEIRELLSLQYVKAAAGRIAKDQTLLFSLREDPAVRYYRAGANNEIEVSAE
ncbi:beta-galactosidase [Paenibacillus silvisoli]|uniref:beta-galactosidase n=1 Tax=Paenibacillus silvisoli TaxID=3110539 RepID=UPI0028052A37|nr:beta-galactosidase [Paenibacillus silvisoli]